MGEATAIIVTCERDRCLADLCVAGVEKFWPGVKPMILLDTDDTTEAPLPDDIRALVRRMPVLKRVFDVPFVSPTERIYSLDSDCLIYSEPTDFSVPAYQGTPGWDAPNGIKVWHELGVEMPKIAPRFCGGMYSYRRVDFLDAKDAAIAYLRKCVEMGLHETAYPGVVCEQSLVAGMWRMAYPDNCLPFERYPINEPTKEQVIFHISDRKGELWVGTLIDEYKTGVLA